MTEEQIAILKAVVLRYECEAAGMKAENSRCALLDMIPTYGRDDFALLGKSLSAEIKERLGLVLVHGEDNQKTQEV